MDSTTAKKRLRGQLRDRETPPAAEAAAAAERIRDLLLAEPVVASAVRIAMYAALPDEIPTRPLFEALIRAGRPCLFPRTRSNGQLSFSCVERPSDLRPSRYGVEEPPATHEEVLGGGDVVIVPGLAFARSGVRLGRGGGYYDRTFPVEGSAQPCLIGAVYADRIVESLPHASHDRAMDAIVTEQEFRWMRGRE